MRGLRILGAVVLAFAMTSAFAETPGAAFAQRVPQNANRDPEAAATIVVFNVHDSDSAKLARFYAAKRGIANDHVVGLKCPVQEEITRADYDGTIAEPLREIFTKNGWWDLRPEIGRAHV